MASEKETPNEILKRIAAQLNTIDAGAKCGSYAEIVYGERSKKVYEEIILRFENLSKQGAKLGESDHFRYGDVCFRLGAIRANDGKYGDALNLFKKALNEFVAAEETEDNHWKQTMEGQCDQVIGYAKEIFKALNDGRYKSDFEAFLKQMHRSAESSAPSVGMAS